MERGRSKESHVRQNLAIIDSHPVQYRVPIWRELARLGFLSIRVIYASDCSVRGYEDTGFGKTVVWDDPMLEGYSYEVLDQISSTQPNGYFSLRGAGIWKALLQEKPDYVLLTGLNYLFDWKALVCAKLISAKVGLRCETQDEAAEQRSKLKSTVRDLVYKMLYSQIDHFFYIGEKNKKHYQKLGIQNEKLIPAYYFTLDRFNKLTEDQKEVKRMMVRTKYKIDGGKVVIGFSGKFIEKKNPKILFEMLQNLPKELQKKIVLYFVGSGELEESLKTLAKEANECLGVQTVFTGFVNQSEIGNHYLAMDLFVLPSRLMGETWGLVVNEALQAGCSVVVSDAVGCGGDFKSLERFRIFRTNDEVDLSHKIRELAKFERDFDWCEDIMQKYSLQTTVESIKDTLIH